MRFHNQTAELFIPDSMDESGALARITHLGIGAHQDDLEFMAFHGILACYRSNSEWFGGITCTDGALSARSGPYAHFDGQQMRAIRHREQNLASQIGNYGVMIQLDYTSSAVKDPNDVALSNDLIEVLRATKPSVVYTHNLADKHGTHIGVAVAAIQAMRTLPPDQRPGIVYGCEVWRDLDWMPDDEKVLQDVSFHENLAAALNGVFDSQIAGGKRYDNGVLGRRRANATFFESHAIDSADSIAYAMDLTPLVHDEKIDITRYVDELIGRFRDDVITKLNQRLGH